MMMTLPDSVLSFQAEEEAGGEVFQVINAHLHSIIFNLPAFYLLSFIFYLSGYQRTPAVYQIYLA